MKRLASLLLVVTLAGTGAACHTPVTITTPQGKVAYSADLVVQRLAELQNAAIAANAQTDAAGKKGLDDATTRLVVEFCVASATTLKQSPNGWLATVSTAWTALKAKLLTVTNPILLAAESGVDVVLAAAGASS